MPGVNIVTNTIPSPTGFPAGESAPFFVSGLTERGDTVNPVAVHSLSEYVQLLGSRVTYGSLYDALQVFFAEGGGLAYVARAVGPAATKGTVTLNDAAHPTVRIDATSEGSWSSEVAVTVAAGVLANTVTITVTFRGTTETFANLASPTAIVTALANSQFVRATDLGSVSVAPANLPTAGTSNLSAGSDDRTNATSTVLVNALARFGAHLGPGTVAIPGQTSAVVGAGLIAHAQAFGRLALLATAQGQSVTNAVSAANALRSTSGAEYAGLFYPWVKIPDGAGGVRTVPPEGFVAGVHARTVDQIGPWQPPAGESFGAAQFVTDVEVPVNRSDGDTLDASAVSAIRPIAGVPTLYGWDSLSADTVDWQLLTGRDLMNVIAFTAKQRFERFVFRAIDGRGHLFAEMAAELVGIAEPIRQAGGLYENPGVDPGYSVDTGPDVNTAQTIAANQANAKLSVRVAPSGTLVTVTISKAALGAAV